MAECECGNGLKSLHLDRDCKKYLRKASDIMFIQGKGSAGKNSIDLSTIPIPESVFTGLFQAQDPIDRLHILYDVKNTEFDIIDGNTFDWADGTSTKITKDGLTLMFIVPETSIGFNGNVTDLECKNPQAFIRTVDNQIVGYGNPDTIASDQKLYPLPIESIKTKVMPMGTDDNIPNVEVLITFRRTMDYGNWIVINSDQHEFDVAENYEPKDAVFVRTSTAVTATTMEVKVSERGNGILGNSVPIVGLLPTDFVVTSNGSPVVLAAAPESPAGTYLLTFASQTNGDQLKASLAPTSGYVGSVVTELVP